MRKRLSLIVATLGMLAAMDFILGATLELSRSHAPALERVVRYFDYGRSIPGRYAQWRADPGARGNLFDVAWRPEMIADSREQFEAEAADTEALARTTLRSYGMSFVNHIVGAAVDAAPETLRADIHAGPNAPPNFTFAVFLDDRAARRAGDVAVLGVLSSSIAPMAALSNRSWVVDQPAPFTYPVFRPEDDGLRRIDPLVESRADEIAALEDPERGAAWRAQQRAEDRFHTELAYLAPWLDASPFARLIRRSTLARIQGERRAAILDPDDGFPYAEVLRRMAVAFARVAREDGQIPVVMLVQGRDGRDPDLAALLRPTLERLDIPYLATVDHFDPRDMSGFIADGHYTDAVNAIFGAALADVIATAQADQGAAR